MEGSLDINYKEKYEQLIKDKKNIELEFGQKRAQFRQLYLDCENQLKSEKETNRQLEIQANGLTKQLDSLKSESEGIRIAAQISEESKEEEVAALKVNYQEEIASLQHIWQEASKENQTQLAKEFEEERNKLLQANLKLEQCILDESKVISSEESKSSDGLMSIMSSAFSKRSSSSLNVSKQKVVDSTSQSLEGSQQQIKMDVDAWKSVVAPLEQENMSLRKQLAESNKKVKEQNLRAEMTPGQLTQDKFQEKLLESKMYLDAERSSRTDLEMYVAVLNTQKGVLQEDADKLRRELHNVCRILEQEKMNHNELKETWKLANEQFLEQQNNLIFQFNTMRKLLTRPQFEQLSRDLRRTQAQPEPIKTMAEQPYQVPVQEIKSKDIIQTIKKSDLISFDSTNGVPTSDSTSETKTLDKIKSASPRQLRKKLHQTKKVPQTETQKLSDSIFNALFPAAKDFNQILQGDGNINEKPLLLSSSSDSEEDDIEQAIMKQNMNRYAIDEQAEEVNETPAMSTQKVPTIEKIQLMKSASSDNILSPSSSGKELLHEKSLSQGDVSWSNNLNVSNKSVDKFTGDEVDSKLSLNETGWSTLSDEYGHACMMCQNYEKQLQRLQKEFMAVKEKDDQLNDNLQSLQDQLDSEKENFILLEKSIESAAGDTKSQINIYKTNQQEVDKQVNILCTQFEQFQKDMTNEMKTVYQERDHILAKCTQMTEENECLKNTSTTLPLASSEYEGDATTSFSEEQLKTEIMFLKDRVIAEQFDRETTENILEQDLVHAREEVTKLKHELDQIKAVTLQNS